MKKLLCLLLSATLLLACLSILIGAEETAPEAPEEKTLDDHLTAWWNFNGDTEKEQLRDKAPGGKTSDNLYRIASSADALTVENGVCTVKPDSGTTLWLDMSAGNSDVRLTEKTTIFLKFRFSGTNTGHGDIMQMEGLYRIFRHANGDLRITLDNAKKDGAAVTLISSEQIVADQDIYFAFVSNVDTETKTLQAAIYLSTDGNTYTKTEFSYDNMTFSYGAGRTSAKNYGLYIGNHRVKADDGLDYQFDDIRIFDKSFTDEEVAQISKLETPEAPEKLPEVTTADPNVTTAEPRPQPPAEGTINDYLITWWNFEGADATEQMKDKAVRGQNDDNLEIKGTVTVEDGVAYISKDEGNGLFAARSEDLIGVENMTVYAKLKYNGIHTDWPDSIFYDGLYRFFNYQYDATYADTSLRTCLLGSNYIVSALTEPQDQWFYVILTTEINTETSKSTLTISLSNDGIVWDTTTMTKDIDIATLSTIKVKQNAEQGGLYLGKSSRLLDRGVGFWFDDVRIYSKALSTDEYALIQENTTDLRDPSQITTTTEPESPTATTVPDAGEVTQDQPAVTTQRPVLTAAPRTQAATTPENAPATTPVTNAPSTGSSGCGATVTVGLALILITSGVAAVAVRKKND